MKLLWEEKTSLLPLLSEIRCGNWLLHICQIPAEACLNSASPSGGFYQVNGLTSITFTPSVLNVGSNTINYTYT